LSSFLASEYLEGPVIGNELEFGFENILFLNFIVPNESFSHDGNKHVHHDNDEEERCCNKANPN
jgi:hypothetical protein